MVIPPSNDSLFPLVVAHRGYAKYVPENTLQAFVAALELGAGGIELDIWECASGEFVVSHDENIQGLGSIRKNTLNQILGKTGNPIFTLESILADLVGASVNIEIKGSKDRTLNDITLVVESLVKLVSQFHQKHNLIFSTFDRNVAAQFFRMKRYGSTALLVSYRQGLTSSINFAKANGIESIYLNWRLANRYSLGKIKRAGLSYSLWTVDNKRAIGKAIRSGANCIITNEVPLALSMVSDF